jgi:hypothetical protein
MHAGGEQGCVYGLRRLFLLIYVGIGVVVAWKHDYFDSLNTWRQILSALLAIALWPLILLGINLHIRK